MPNHVQAAAEGMPAINRRSLLLGLAAASTAAATVTVATAAAPAENPELIRLGDALPALVAEYADARANRSAIVKEWSPRWPAAPDEILTGWSSGGDIERDLAGSGITHPNQWGEDRSRAIWTAKELQAIIDSAKACVRRARTDRTRARSAERAEPYAAVLPIAMRYEARCKRIRDASGIAAATARRDAVERALVLTIDAIMELEESSMAGVFIKAQAMAATSHLPFYAGIANGSLTWGTTLAASIIRQAGGVS